MEVRTRVELVSGKSHSFAESSVSNSGHRTKFASKWTLALACLQLRVTSTIHHKLTQVDITEFKDVFIVSSVTSGTMVVVVRIELTS